MALTISNRKISTVCLIDDDESVRESYLYNLQDLELEPDSIEGPIDNLPNFILEHSASSQAAICDQNLVVGGYSKFYGAEIAAEWYKKEFPVILCTKYSKEISAELRKFRPYIPSLIEPDDLNPESIHKHLEICINEFNGRILASRELWKSLIRVESVDDETNARNTYLNLIIPSWHTQEGIRLMMNDLPQELQTEIKDGTRLQAFVNIGAERHEDLFFKDWSIIKA